MSGRRVCRKTSGDRFTTKREAEQAEIERKINNGVNGQRVQVTYVVKSCRCNGWHLTTTGARDAQVRDATETFESRPDGG